MAVQVRLPIRATMPATGTLTQTTTPTRGTTREGQLSPPMGTLRLRGAPEAERRTIRWAEDVVDNEGMGRKKSKGCAQHYWSWSLLRGCDLGRPYADTFRAHQSAVSITNLVWSANPPMNRLTLPQVEATANQITVQLEDLAAIEEEN